MPYTLFFMEAVRLASHLVGCGSRVLSDTGLLSGRMWVSYLVGMGISYQVGCWSLHLVGCGPVVRLDVDLLSAWTQFSYQVDCRSVIGCDASFLSGWMLVCYQVECKSFIRLDAGPYQVGCGFLSGLMRVCYQVWSKSPFGNRFGIRLDVSWETKEMEKIHNSCKSLHSSVHTIWNGYLCT